MEDKKETKCYDEKGKPCTVQKICKKGSDKVYCKGGVLSADMPSGVDKGKRYAGCPCKASEKYDLLI